MNLKFAYNDNSEILFRQVRDSIAEKYPLIIVEGFHENFMKERKKAFGLKGSFSARLSPFAALYDSENNPVKAFYSEVNECTLDNIVSILDSIVSNKNNVKNESTSN